MKEQAEEFFYMLYMLYSDFKVQQGNNSGCVNALCIELVICVSHHTNNYEFSSYPKFIFNNHLLCSHITIMPAIVSEVCR
jgi:hypothetical protein